MGNTINTLGDFPAAARKVALDEQVPIIDLNKIAQFNEFTVKVEIYFEEKNRDQSINLWEC